MVSRIDNIKLPYLGRGFNEEDAERKVNEYILEILEAQRSVQSQSDIIDFFPLVQKALRAREEEDGVPEEKRLLLLEDDPPEEIDTEAITWYLKARVPGRFDQGPAGPGRIKEVVAHVRSIIEHPDHPNEKLLTFGKFYGNWIQFNIYARNSKRAMERLLWFERTMSSFNWYFRLYGYTVIEEGVGDKDKVTIKDLELVKYPVTYFIRSDDTYHTTSQELKRVLVDINVSTF
jgi:hypothetical protein